MPIRDTEMADSLRKRFMPCILNEWPTCVISLEQMRFIASILPPTTSAGDETYRMDADEHSIMQSALLKSVTIKRPSSGDGELVERLRGLLHKGRLASPSPGSLFSVHLNAIAEALEALDASSARVKELEEARAELKGAARGVHQYRMLVVNTLGSDNEAVRCAERVFDRLHSALNPSPTEQEIPS